MKKIISVVSALAVTGSLLAGGLVTNTNQSALYTRLQSRNASTGIDAVYYNPAGLTKLSDGFHLSLNNQTIGQTKTVTTTYPYLADSPRDFVGKVSAPVSEFMQSTRPVNLPSHWVLILASGGGGANI
ncbi:MAG: hypothetical protein R2758_11290 [Bacteroidales bacterium]